MKAMVYTSFGPPEVLQLQDVETPVPQENEIQVRVHTTSVGFGDLIARDFAHTSPGSFNMPFLFWLLARVSFGLRAPRVKILGSEFAGEVSAAGKNVKRFKEGDQVFGYLGQTMGAYAEYLCMPEDGVVTAKPANMSHDEAAPVPSGAMTALAVLEAADLQIGQRVLINGASGGIGSHVVQLAKSQFGAEVTGVCSTARLGYVRSLGADKVIDYTQEDFADGGETYDVIIDILGRSSFSRCKDSLAENGRYVRASWKMRELLQVLWTRISGSRKVICVLSPQSAEQLVSVKELIEAGKIRSIIDRRFPLEETAEAHRYVEEGRKTGHVVIVVTNSSGGGS